MNLAEVLAVSLTAVLASAAITAYLLDAVGLALHPVVVLAVSVAIGGRAGWLLRRTADLASADLAAWIGVVLSVFAWLLSLAWPSLVPPGPGSVDHLLLVDYVERTGRLVRDPSLAGLMGETAHYPPGADVLAVLMGAWTGTDGLHAFYSLLAAGTALAAGFVYLIARRLLLPTSFALAAVLFLLLPRYYFVGAFTQEALLAQSMCVLFAVASWWALITWDAKPFGEITALFGVCVTAAFLVWPMWIGPSILVFAVLLLRRHATAHWRLGHLRIAMIPLVIVVVIHAAQGFEWMLVASSAGAVPRPSWAELGWIFPALALVGLVQAINRSRTYITLGFVVAIVGQAMLVLMTAGAQTADLASSMIYLAIYPLAVLAALGLHASIPSVSPAAPTLGWFAVAILVLTAVMPAVSAPKPAPPITADLFSAGGWMRANVGASCADYLVADRSTAYWLHLAVLGNPLSSPRTAEVDPRAEAERWAVGDEKRGYAVVDLTTLSDEVISDVEILAQFGRGAVVRRPGAGACEAP